MGLRPSQRDEDAARRVRGINDLDCVFNRVPMGLRPSQRDEDAARRIRGINDLDCVFNRAVRK